MGPTLQLRGFSVPHVMSPTYLLCFSKIRVEGPKPSSYKIPTLQRKRSKYKIFMAFNPFCIFDSFSHFRIKSIPFFDSQQKISSNLFCVIKRLSRVSQFVEVSMVPLRTWIGVGVRSYRLVVRFSNRLEILDCLAGLEPAQNALLWYGNLHHWW